MASSAVSYTHLDVYKRQVAKVVSRAVVSRMRWMFMGLSLVLNNNNLRVVSMLDEQRPDAVLPQ